jgi:hypothetical protein
VFADFILNYSKFHPSSYITTFSKKSVFILYEMKQILCVWLHANQMKRENNTCNYAIGRGHGLKEIHFTAISRTHGNAISLMALRLYSDKCSTFLLI